MQLGTAPLLSPCTTAWKCKLRIPDSRHLIQHFTIHVSKPCVHSKHVIHRAAHHCRRHQQHRIQQTLSSTAHLHHSLEVQICISNCRHHLRHLTIHVSKACVRSKQLITLWRTTAAVINNTTHSKLIPLQLLATL
jgi:hypothetical protein